MKGLSNLIRLHKLKLTEQQKKLTDLQAVAHGLQSETEAIDKSAREEAVNAENNAETAFLLGGYVQASLTRRATLQASLAEIEREMAIVRDLVATAFRELKRYELIAQRHEADRTRDRRKRERHTENEVGMLMHRQKERSSGN